jgi:2-dehydropantoate 2-reductase
MDSWLLNHLALVCPLGNAIYSGGGDNYTASKNRTVMKNTALAMKEGFRFLRKSGTGINPKSNLIILNCPTFLLSFFLKIIFNTRWANTVIANHALNARNEMRNLSKGFIHIAYERGEKLPVFEEMSMVNPESY